MTRENFSFLEDEFNKQLSAKDAEIEKKYGALKAAKQSEAAITKIQTNDNLKITDRAHGVSEKDFRNTKKALAANVKSDSWFLEQEMAKEKEKFKKALEKQMWKDHGNRIQAKEKAYGPNDPEVAQHRKEREEKARQLQEMEKARLEKNKPTPTKDFNKEAANQNYKEQFRKSAGKTR